MQRVRIDVERYAGQLRASMRQLLPAQGLPLIDGRAWSGRVLVTCAVLMACVAGPTLATRFDAARAAVVAMYPSRKRPGKTYAGFIDALAARGAALLAALLPHLRERTRALAEADGHWLVEGWCVFAGDGSKLDCPMTVANERGLGCASRAKSGPQALLTVLAHPGTGLPWAWRVCGARGDERGQLRQMLEELPDRSLLATDAGFAGFDLLKTVLACGHQFVIRVGANVRLLTRLGYACEVRGDVVYLWPLDAQRRGRSPLVLRLVTLLDGRNRRVALLTSIADPALLSDAGVAAVYRRRWGIELLYRALKQTGGGIGDCPPTMGRGKLLSTGPAHALVEAEWTVLGVLVLGLTMLAARAPEIAPQRRRPPQSIARALRAVRDAAAGRRPLGRRSLALALSDDAAQDDYERPGPKAARHWPHRKNPDPPGEPKARTATAAEVLFAQEIGAERRPRSSRRCVTRASRPCPEPRRDRGSDVALTARAAFDGRRAARTSCWSRGSASTAGPAPA